MPSNSFEDIHPVALRSNWLTVNGETLRADVMKNTRSEKLTVSAKELESILLLGRQAILEGIEDFYEEQVRKNPGATVVRPSIWTAQLGTTAQTDGVASKVFTEQGRANGGVNVDIGEIQPAFHDHWNVIKEAGFLPEVRRTSTKKDGGSWLLLRKPTLDEVLHTWFEYPEESTSSALRTIVDDNERIVRQNLIDYRMRGEQKVDAAPDSERSRQQIGLLLSMAAIRSALDDRIGYEEEIDDVFTYVDNEKRIDVTTVRAIENSTFAL